MMHRDISHEQAEAVLQILKAECGYRVNARDSKGFIRSVITNTDGPALDHVCREYRFCGALGFGGKFRNNGNHDNTPYVDCYQEDETPARLKMIACANVRLAALFAPPPKDQDTP